MPRPARGDDPDVVVACVGGGSNAIGHLHRLRRRRARLVGVEPAGGAAVGRGKPGVVHGMRSYLLQDEVGQVEEASRSRPGSTTRASARSTRTSPRSGGPGTRAVTDAEVIDAFQLLARTEGIIPALESAHALAWIVREAGSTRRARRC